MFLLTLLIACEAQKPGAVDTGESAADASVDEATGGGGADGGADGGGVDGAGDSDAPEDSGGAADDSGDPSDDADGDGYSEDEGDCDDADSGVHPGAEEVCDERDNDCDEVVDEDASDARVWYLDADGDGYGDQESAAACAPPADHVAEGGDCDDADAATNPGAAEDDCADPSDYNCDGSVGYDDSDGDGWAACEECDDTDGGVNPGADEAPYDGADNDCDPATPDDDLDGDGFPLYDDCDDDPVSGPAVNPDAEEICGDGLDNDCDGADDVCDEGVLVDVALASAAARLIGEAAGDEAGYAVAVAGDVDGDGGADLLIGARSESSAGALAGAAYLVTGAAALSGDVDLSAATRFTGEDSYSGAGGAVAGAGDVDGDGYSDLLIGAYYDSEAGSGAGAAFLVLGDPSLSGGALSGADAKLLGADTFDYAGSAVAGAGDVDGDGTPDLLVGARGESTGGASAGAAYLVLGPVSGDLALSGADAALIGEATNDFAGHAVAGAGDVDGDGFDDLLVGAYGKNVAGADDGAAYLVLGPASGSIDLADADAVMDGEAAGDEAGASVSGAGDLDGDGRDDFLVGAPEESSAGSLAGAAYLVLGASVGGAVSGAVDLSAADARLTGADNVDYAGTAVSGGDLDGDGRSDLVIGVPYSGLSGINAGAAWVVLAGGNLSPVSGVLDLADADIVFTAEDAGDYAGASVSAGDVDSDGADDLLIGAFGSGAGGATAGAAYLVIGL